MCPQEPKLFPNCYSYDIDAEAKKIDVCSQFKIKSFSSSYVMAQSIVFYFVFLGSLIGHEKSFNFNNFSFGNIP